MPLNPVIVGTSTPSIIYAPPFHLPHATHRPGAIPATTTLNKLAAQAYLKQRLTHPPFSFTQFTQHLLNDVHACSYLAPQEFVDQGKHLSFSINVLSPPPNASLMDDASSHERSLPRRQALPQPVNKQQLTNDALETASRVSKRKLPSEGDANPSKLAKLSSSSVSVSSSSEPQPQSSPTQDSPWESNIEVQFEWREHRGSAFMCVRELMMLANVTNASDQNQNLLPFVQAFYSTFSKIESLRPILDLMNSVSFLPRSQLRGIDATLLSQLPPPIEPTTPLPCPWPMCGALLTMRVNGKPLSSTSIAQIRQRAPVHIQSDAVLDSLLPIMKAQRYSDSRTTVSSPFAQSSSSRCLSEGQRAKTSDEIYHRLSQLPFYA